MTDLDVADLRRRLAAAEARVAALDAAARAVVPLAYRQAHGEPNRLEKVCNGCSANSNRGEKHGYECKVGALAALLDGDA